MVLLRLFLIVLFGFSFIQGQPFEDIESRLQDRLYRDVDVAIIISDLSRSNSLYKVQPHLDFIPASLTKLFLTGTCLDYLSTSYRFKTKVYLDKEDIPSLYVKGEGDPNQTREQFILIAKALKKKNIGVLKSIILDASKIQMDANLYGNSARYYYALGGALNFNYNQIRLMVNEDQKQLTVSPESSFVDLDIRSLRYLSSKKRGFPKISLHQRPGFDKYIIRGAVSKQDEMYTNLNLRVSRPTHFYASMLKQVLLDHDIRVIEPLSFERFYNKKKKRLLTLTSLPLFNYLEDMNQDSSNMIASSILKVLGKLKYGEPGTQRKGLLLMDQFMHKRLDVQTDMFKFKDGSGLSSYNRITADHVSRFLTYFKKKYPESIKTMFVDIKQSSDYDDMEVPEHYDIYVKSGTLSNLGVNNLAGYVNDSRIGKSYSFVILTKYRDNKEPAYKGTLSNPLLQQILASIQKMSLN
ncbi:D-alanyl-D-alanine carboxypeptidase/D-alanyl-D-alanine-endopeptidase [bacterium]|nr:D-alanyl-D-alanine carboxypeptidase/D-alanyl-D-alanine-endopeptidase [bacterium]